MITIIPSGLKVYEMPHFSCPHLKILAQAFMDKWDSDWLNNPIWHLLKLLLFLLFANKDSPQLPAKYFHCRMRVGNCYALRNGNIRLTSSFIGTTVNRKVWVGGNQERVRKWSGMESPFCSCRDRGPWPTPRHLLVKRLGWYFLKVPKEYRYPAPIDFHITRHWKKLRQSEWWSCSLFLTLVCT